MMLHKKTALYKKGRSNDLLKLKPYTDAEATVLGYKEGKGKFSKMVGSLKVQGDDSFFFPKIFCETLIGFFIKTGGFFL